MPSDMRFQCPSEDAPPSPRPPSVASSSTSTSGGTPRRSTSMDSLNTNSSTSEKPAGEEYIPTRLIRATPKINTNAMQFVKTGPATLHKSAKEQMKKAEVVKSLRKTSLQEEEEWQSISSANLRAPEVGSDWQSNLDKWKSSRRKRNEDVLERVIEVKKNEIDEEFSKARRKSKTFSEMREDKSKRGRRYNLVVHDDDNNDLGDLGLGQVKTGPSSLSDPPEETEVKFADTKSDAGFCTGSDTGSDGVFAEDNISDTSSALGDKREIHDSLLESSSSVSSSQKDSGDLPLHALCPPSTPKTANMSEYTYDKAIEDYKQFAENSAKKRSSSVTSLSSNASGSKEDEKTVTSSQRVVTSSSLKMEEKLSFFDGSSSSRERLEKEPPPPRGVLLRREKGAPKVDIDKRRSMFELRDIDQQQESRGVAVRRSVEGGGVPLRHKVASFECLTDSEVKARGITPPRDARFKEKLASFSQKERPAADASPRRKTPERDQNFYQKLQNFAQIEERKNLPQAEARTALPRSTSERRISSSLKTSDRYWDRRAPPPTPLKDRIASFENLSPLESSPSRREMSASMECLNKPLGADGGGSRSSLHSSQSVTNLFRRTTSTPFVVMEVDESAEEKKSFVRRTASRDYETKVLKSNQTDSGLGKARVARVESSPEVKIVQEVPQVPPPRIPDAASSRESEVPASRPVPEVPVRRILPETPEVRTFRTPSEAPEVRAARVLPVTPEVRSSRNLPETPADTFAARTLPEAPPQVPDMPPPPVPEVPSTWAPKAVEESPPPVPPPRVPTIEVPSSTLLEEVPPSPSAPLSEGWKEAQHKTALEEYGDRDIDEAMGDYEQLSDAITAGDVAPIRPPFESDPQENVYEKICDEEPVYENIYEKVSDGPSEPSEGPLNHHYQTLDEVNTEKATLPPLPPQTPNPALSPTLPPKNKSLSVFEVLDVTWTEDNSGSPAAPPSVPPPPPPPEEEEEEEEEEKPSEGVSMPPAISPSATPVETESRTLISASSSQQTTKNDLRKKMSDFLGSTPQVEEELTLQPPPDANELLRHEREAERLIVQRQANLSRESPLMDFEFPGGSAPFGRTKYTWEDRMKADVPKSSKVDLDESNDHLEFQTKLAELEQEMVTHDRSMLQRVKGPHLQEDLPYSQELSPQIPPPSQYGGKQSEPLATLPPSSSIPPLPASPSNPPPPLPIQEFYTAPTFTKYEESSEGLYEAHNKVVQESVYTESTTISREVKRMAERPEDLPCKPLPAEVPPPVPRKQSILALSAIPKPKLTDNDSWIMKRKAEAGKKDYSKHWLIQEAEQRRLEQQDRISRPTQLPMSKPSNTFPSTPGYQSHFQNMKSSFHSNTSSSSTASSSPTSYNPPPNVVANGSNGSPLSPSKPIPTTSFPNNNNNNNTDSFNKHIFPNGPSNSPSNSSSSSNNSWKKQTKTYQPPQPSPPSGSSKPLPDAIINTLTQRVNNKNKVNGSTRTTVYNSSTYRDDNYHDYMNTDTFNPAHNNNSPVVSTPVPPGQQGAVHLPPAGQQGHLSEEQRLLSVSGKKKCSHCGEELGRGAAMIIESLRLFYHIPCFKCCVCGTQLGNGTSGADVRVRNHKLHCHNCYSNDEGMKFSKV